MVYGGEPGASDAVLEAVSSVNIHQSRCPGRRRTDSASFLRGRRLREEDELLDDVEAQPVP